MKKLFSRAVVAMLSLFVGCSSAFAEIGYLYVGNENPFSVGGTKTPECKVLINNDTGDFYAANGERVPGRWGIANYEFFRAKDKKYLSTPQKMVAYRFHDATNTMYRGFLYSALDKKTNKKKTFRCDFEPVARMFCTGERTREIRVIPDGGSRFKEFLFKIEYYRDPHEGARIRDFEHRKYYTGYYIKKYDDSIVGKVVGEYFPIEFVMYLVLSGELKI